MVNEPEKMILKEQPDPSDSKLLLVWFMLKWLSKNYDQSAIDVMVEYNKGVDIPSSLEHLRGDVE